MTNTWHKCTCITCGAKFDSFQLKGEPRPSKLECPKCYMGRRYRASIEYPKFLELEQANKAQQINAVSAENARTQLQLTLFE